MSREKQIEEMAKIIVSNSYLCKDEYLRTTGKHNRDNCEKCDLVNCCIPHRQATDLYNAGYRKQEWISVDDRLPEEYGDYLVAVKTKKLWETEWEHGVSAACFVISEIPNVNGWHIEIEDGYQYEITHWMPLPEPPKMKGGAE